jgi:hypothetical protein
LRNGAASGGFAEMAAFGQGAEESELLEARKRDHRKIQSV